MLNATNSLALEADSHDLGKEEKHSFWIRLNEFSARLTNARICNMNYKATFLCDVLLKDQNLGENPAMWAIQLSNIAQKLRKNPTLFTVALSAAAQHMIHAAFSLYAFCENKRTRFGQTYRWDDWKAIFEEAARTVESVPARNDAFSAGVAMNTAERVFKSCKESGEK